MLCRQYGMHQSCSRCFSILEHHFSTQMRLCRRDSKYTLMKRNNIRSTVKQSTKTIEWTVNRLADQTTGDQSNQAPSQQVSNQPS